MVGTGWEVSTHLTPSVIAALLGAGYLGKVNSWSGSEIRVKSRCFQRKEQQDSSQVSCQVASWVMQQAVLPEQEPLETAFYQNIPSVLRMTLGVLEFENLHIHVLRSILLPTHPAKYLCPQSRGI